jgi:hypothetical protein
MSDLELFIDALERGPDQWHSFLAEKCAGDEELRASVERLLRSFQQAGALT